MSNLIMAKFMGGIAAGVERLVPGYATHKVAHLPKPLDYIPDQNQNAFIDVSKVDYTEYFRIDLNMTTRPSAYKMTFYVPGGWTQESIMRELWDSYRKQL